MTAQRRRRRRHSKRWYRGMRNRILFGLSIVLLVVLIVFGGMTIAKSLTQSTAAKPQQTESQETEQVKKPKFLKNYSAVEMTKYYTYGTHLSLEGNLSVEGTVKNVFLLMVPSESTGPSDYTQRQILNYDSTTGVFQTAKELNEGLCLEGFEDNNYYLMLSVVYGDGSVDYYRVKDASGEEPLVYYTLTDTATGTNQKIEMSQEEDTAMLSITTTELPADVYDIVIDPGHGGNDAGTVSGEYCERDLVLNVSLKTKELLEAAGYKVLLTRDGSEGPDLKMAYTMYDEDGRVNVSCRSKAKYEVSIHINSNEVLTSGGVQVYGSCRANSGFAKLLADQIVSEVGTSYSPMETGCREPGAYVHSYNENDIQDAIASAQNKGYEPYNITTDTDYLFMIREVGGIATGAYVDGRNTIYGSNLFLNSNQGVECALVELGFISVEEDRNNMVHNSDGYAKGIANAIVQQILSDKQEDSVTTAP